MLALDQQFYLWANGRNNLFLLYNDAFNSC